ncbi:hypothetical protein C1H46_034605 [Malus baccata]|uniref:NB-ARC domain-containing protein n=1 Tax=Malus baccata TaxID=106549 RepID=A0A540L028_MALBA|nr:hypothetical protein C1H46_034605 [Malus baccata]
MQWGLRTLTSLRNLKISFENSPKEGLLPTTITFVFISCLSNLDGKGFRHLTSLENLTIVKCPELQRLPEERLPASLSELILKKCPLLQQWCQSEGKDWPKIAHIPHIEIDGEPIYLGGLTSFGVLGTSGSVVDDLEAAELLKVSYANLVVLPKGCSSFPLMFFSIFKIFPAVR